MSPESVKMKKNYDFSQMRGIKNPYLRHSEQTAGPLLDKESEACIKPPFEDNHCEQEDHSAQESPPHFPTGQR